MKKVLSFVLSVFMLVSFLSITSFAAENEIMVQPRWANTSVVNCSLSFKDANNGYAEIVVSGKQGVDTIVIDIQIYRQSGSVWIEVASDTMSYNGRTVFTSFQTTGISGAYYQAVFTVTVYKDDVPEVITKTCYATCP